MHPDTQMQKAAFDSAPVMLKDPFSLISRAGRFPLMARQCYSLAPDRVPPRLDLHLHAPLCGWGAARIAGLHPDPAEGFPPEVEADPRWVAAPRALQAGRRCIVRAARGAEGPRKGHRSRAGREAVAGVELGAPRDGPDEGAAVKPDSAERRRGRVERDHRRGELHLNPTGVEQRLGRRHVVLDRQGEGDLGRGTGRRLVRAERVGPRERQADAGRGCPVPGRQVAAEGREQRQGDLARTCFLRGDCAAVAREDLEGSVGERYPQPDRVGAPLVRVDRDGSKQPGLRRPVHSAGGVVSLRRAFLGDDPSSHVLGDAHAHVLLLAARLRRAPPPGRLLWRARRL
uniref:Uncharacterized protein n=1 Tax=Tetraselmis sp. GSL018 TaxID=582737 RepID=A0A061QXD8_9CHLO